MSRYKITKQIKDKNGVRIASTTIIPPMPLSENDIYIQVVSSERLDLLANKFYGDSSLWWAIAASNGLGKGTFAVPENTKLRIPDIENILSVINNVNMSR